MLVRPASTRSLGWCWRCLTLFALFGAPERAEAQLLPKPPRSPDLFSVALHGEYTREALGASLTGMRLSEAAWALFDNVQERTDYNPFWQAESQGDHNLGSYYLHHVWPNKGYASSAHDRVLTALGVPHVPGQTASIDQFIALSSRRFEEELVHLLVERGDALNARDVGMIIYAIGVRVHTVQDRKHRMQYPMDVREIRSIDHFLTYPAQFFSDVDPESWRPFIALRDTRAFFRDLDTLLEEQVDRPWRAALGAAGDRALSPKKRLYDALASYAATTPAIDLRPALEGDGVTFSMAYMFPNYEWNCGQGRVCMAKPDRLGPRFAP